VFILLPLDVFPSYIDYELDELEDLFLDDNDELLLELKLLLVRLFRHVAFIPPPFTTPLISMQMGTTNASSSL